jgi:hypothetical protein
MLGYDKTIDSFHEYADRELRNHQLELSTRYNNQPIDGSTRQEAYKKHREIYQRELSHEIDVLIRGRNNVWLAGELESLKHIYLTQLTVDNNGNAGKEKE